MRHQIPLVPILAFMLIKTFSTLMGKSCDCIKDGDLYVVFIYESLLVCNIYYVRTWLLE